MWPAASGSPKIMGMTTLHIPNGPALRAHRITIPNRLGKCLPRPASGSLDMCHGTRSLRCRNSSRPSTGKESSRCCTTGPDHVCAQGSCLRSTQRGAGPTPPDPARRFRSDHRGRTGRPWCSTRFIGMAWRPPARTRQPGPLPRVASAGDD